MSARPVDYEDIQGIVRFGYKRMTQAIFLLLRVTDVDAARAWIAKAPVTSAVAQEPPPATALQIAFTSDGLRALEVAEDIVEGFSTEFIVGMSSDPGHSRRLGDIGPNDPAGWLWGGSPDSTTGTGVKSGMGTGVNNGMIQDQGTVQRNAPDNGNMNSDGTSNAGGLRKPY